MHVHACETQANIYTHALCRTSSSQYIYLYIHSHIHVYMHFTGASTPTSGQTSTNSDSALISPKDALTAKDMLRWHMKASNPDLHIVHTVKGIEIFLSRIGCVILANGDRAFVLRPAPIGDSNLLPQEVLCTHDQAREFLRYVFCVYVCVYVYVPEYSCICVS